MKNFVQPGDVVSVPAPAGGAVSGAGVLVGALFGVAAYTADEGAPVEISTAGVFELAKAPGDEWAIGEKVYWDPAAKRVTHTVAAGAWIGAASAAASASAAAVRVRLNHQPL